MQSQRGKRDLTIEDDYHHLAAHEENNQVADADATAMAYPSPCRIANLVSLDRTARAAADGSNEQTYLLRSCSKR